MIKRILAAIIWNFVLFAGAGCDVSSDYRPGPGPLGYSTSEKTTKSKDGLYLKKKPTKKSTTKSTKSRRSTRRRK